MANPRKDLRSPVEIGDSYQSSQPNRIQRHWVILSAWMSSTRGMSERGFIRAQKNRWPVMYLGGHLQWEDECKVYGYPCSFSSALGKHLFYHHTIVLVVHKVMLCLMYVYCIHSHYWPPWANFRAWPIHQPPDIISECWVFVDISVSACMFADMQEQNWKTVNCITVFSISRMYLDT